MINHPLRIVHIDDDQHALDSFFELIKDYKEFIYLQGFTDATEAARYLQYHKADLAVLDVEMSGRDGFWLASQIKNLPIDIIFLTSHTEFALRAFEACAIDYLQKPATAARLDEFLERYNTRKTRAQHIQLAQLSEFYERYLPEQEVPRRLFINNVGEINIVIIEDILYFTAYENYTVIKMKEGTKHTTSKLLKIYEEALANHPDFVRIHRSYIVNRNYASKILQDSRKHHISVKMADGEVLEISFQKKDSILKALMK